MQPSLELESRIQLRGIDHIQMEVRDLEESLAFYRDLFGFTERQRGLRQGKRWVIVGVDGTFLSLHEDRAKARNAAAGIRLTHFGLVTTDFVAARERLAAGKVRLDPAEGVIEYEGSRSFYFFDPNGYKVEISEVWGGSLDGAPA